ncbi:hypothetical protein WJX81_000422 [Elliptochloris bilobata]|uniref:SUI1 domain-containing protein n=1 Tax=Elliptochloris bilobata TaxID=381761 RepID=A0AAW1SJP9_9CHLO
MFKKAVSVQTTRPLSGKDVKALRRSIQLQYDLEEDALAQLLPAKAEIALLKLSNRATAYTANAGSPLFFDPSGRGELLVPTVYALWLCPELLPPIYTYSEVSPKVLGGADLFLQGWIVPDGGLGQFASGDLRCVCIPQSPFPFAVGTLEVGSADVAKTGLKGKGLKLLHCYTDQLWGLGDKSVPDPGFTPQRIFPQVSTGDAPTAAADSQAEAASSGAAGAAAGSLEAPAPPVPESQDQLLEYCLLAGLRRVPPTELPCLTSDFYSKYMLPAKPAGANVDVKKSSYKKLSKLLTTFEKKGVLSQKVIHKQDNLNAVNASHALLTSFVEREGASPGASASGGAENGAVTGAENRVVTGGAASSGSAAPKISVTAAYRVPASLRPVFGAAASVDADREALHGEADARAALAGYATREGLAAGGGRLRLDRLLAGALYNKLEPEKEGAVVDEADAAARLLGKLTQFQRIVRRTPQGPLEVVQRGSVKAIQVSMQDRQGGRKHITRIVHVESFAIDPDELGGMLQRKFQTSCSVTKLPGKAETGKEVALQGNLLHEAGKVLAAEYGVPLEFIDVKTKK